MMKDMWKVPLAVLSVIGLTAAVMVALVYTLPAAGQDSCSGVQVNPGDDLDEIVNPDPRSRATRFCVNANSDGTTAIYNISETLLLRDGDKLIGQAGTTETREPAIYGHPVVEIRPTRSLDKLIAPVGTGVEIRWVDLSGATGRVIDGKPQVGTGAGIAGNGVYLVRYAVIHGNDAAGVLNCKGRVLNSEFYDNTNKAAFLGFNGSAVKCITEYEAAYNYVHDEQGNGLWCDVGCKDDPARENGFWAHENLTVNNGRSGIRYESSPKDLAPGVHLEADPLAPYSPGVTALIEGNEVHGNSYDENRGGISASDTQNAVIRDNVFGTKSIAGVEYGPNASKPGAIKAIDSGRASRTDLWNIDIANNVLNGEAIRGCELPDLVVYCANNKGG